MTHPQRSAVRNRLLRTIGEPDFALLAPDLLLTTTHAHQMLIEPHAPIERVFFPESGFVSITTDGARAVELGMVGWEGVAGASPLLLDADRSPHKYYVQAAGAVYAIDVAPLRAALERSASLHRLLLRFVHTLMIQMAQTAFVNATYDIEARLARWLLMCQDRMGGTDVTLTHEFMAVMLGVQRTSVTLAIQTLEGNRLIKARRGRIEVRDREGLMAAADLGYGVPEAEYARVIGDA